MNIRPFIKTYFITASILVHCAVIAAILYFISERATDHWRWPMIKHWVMGDVDKSDIFQLEYDGLASIPKGRWIKVHQQSSEDTVHFIRQEHAGGVFHPYKGQLLLFGSNTHGTEWNNTVYSFDLKTLQWSEAYPADSPSTYTIDYKGIPIAGRLKNHPWAMHTFGALAYDQRHDKLVVASYPGHLSPESYGGTLANQWAKIKTHPTWVYDASTHTWESHSNNTQQFFPYAVAYNSDRSVITGFKPDGIFDWSKEIGWKKVGTGIYPDWHTNVVYDSINHVFILYGGNDFGNDVYAYAAGEKTVLKMPTIGQRPKGDQSVPMAFHPKIGQTIVLIDSDESAKTWLYDYKKDQWQYVEGGDFPYLIGMNYTLVYDSHHDVLVLVNSPANEETAVWALKL